MYDHFSVRFKRGRAFWLSLENWYISNIASFSSRTKDETMILRVRYTFWYNFFKFSAK